MTTQRFEYDWLVIASGFGGSVSALRLAEKDYRGAVLERGRRFRDQDFAKTTWDLRNYLWAPTLGLRGILRLARFKDVFIASGSGVGGGSIVYANTLYRAAPEFFTKPQWADPADWSSTLPTTTPRRACSVCSRCRSIAMAKNSCARSARRSPSNTRSREHRVAVLRRTGQDRSRPLFRWRRAGPYRLHAVRCLHGRVSRRGQEHAAQEYLWFAEKHGARIFPEHQAVDVRPLGAADGSEGYMVTTERPGAWLRKQRRSWTARGVVGATLQGKYHYRPAAGRNFLDLRDIMKPRLLLTSLVLAAVVTPGICPNTYAQSPATAAAPAARAATAQQLPADPWPRVVDLKNGQVLVYQPQVSKWEGNRIDFRSALAIKPTNAKEETFGVIFANARTQVDKVARTVVFEDMKITKADFPTLPDRGAAYTAELQQEFAKSVKSIALDRLQASLALAGIKPPTVPVQNNPPQVIVSYSPAILVPIDGAPVIKPVPGHSRANRVINTRALILQGGLGDNFYIHVYDGWLQSSSLSGPWTQASPGPFMASAMNDIATELSKKGVVDLLDGGAKANPKPSLANGVPAIYTSQVPTELIVFKGQPDFVPIVGTQLLWASNTTSDVLIDTANNNYYVLMAGRWFRSASINGPWTFVASDALPTGFANIPPHSLAGAILPTVAGTPQAQAAVIENSIPQTATVPLKNGPTFTPNFDGPPQYAVIPGTPLSYVANSSEPVIQVAPNSYFAVVAGVWFTATQLTGPWVIATSVPSVIYTIPPSSPIYYVTYVRIYEATPQYVYVGYTPGYLGTVVSPYGTIVYGTGYAYSPWIGSVWYPPPYTYGVAAYPVYNPWVGYTYGFAMGLATAAWLEPYWGGAWYAPAYWGGYPCCATASANVYGHWGNATYSGMRTWYAGGGVAGTTFSGSYATARGTTGDINAGRQYNAWTGNASRGYDRTFNTAAGASGNVARGSNYNVYSGQRSTASAVSATGAGGSAYNRAGATTAGPEGDAHVGGGSTYNAKTGNTNTWATASVGNNHYADVNGNVYKNTGSGWEQHSSSGWSSASGDTSWADKESQARSSGGDRSGGFSEASPMQRYGGGDGGFGGGDRFGGGGGFGGFGGGDRFGGGGFGGGGGWGGRFGGGGGFRGGGFGGRR